MIRIAYVCADAGVPIYGNKGSSVHVQEVVRALIAAGASVTLFASRTEGTPPTGLEEIPLHKLPRVKSDDNDAHEQLVAAANSNLHDALTELGPFDFVYERHSLWSFAAMEYAKQACIPGLLEVNAPLLEEQARYRKLNNPKYATEIVTRAYGAASSLLAVSDAVAEYLEKQDAARGRVKVVPNGVDPQRFTNIIEKKNKISDSFTVGFVGTLKPWHGLSILVSAFAKLVANVPNAHLLIVGDGPQRDTIIKQIDGLGLTKAVTMTGAVSTIEIPQHLSSMDVAVAPYPQLEGFYFSPLKVYEYMASGRAIVASAIGQINNVLVNNKTALLCQPGDIDALVNALKCLNDDPQLRSRLGREALAVVKKRHTWDAVAKTIIHTASEAHNPNSNLQKVG